MGIYNEAITDNSVWLTATPGEQVRRLPFYITEIGHFFAEKNYLTEREFHDSFLFLYTLRGSGKIVADDIEFELLKNSAYIIDCRSRHKYFSAAQCWEFIWFHFNGCAAKSMYEILHANTQKPIKLDIAGELSALIDNISDSSFMGSLGISNSIHTIINDIFRTLIAVNEGSSAPHCDDIETAADFIRKNYASPITIDDIVAKIHISKYHFIRLFHKVMGMSPYSYVTNFRINQAKILLRSTDKTVAQIAEMCGFADTSNFINRFKKHTGETPLKYRKNFKDLGVKNRADHV